MQRRSYQEDGNWLLTYADLATNLLVFFVMLLAASDVSRSKMQQIAEGLSGTMSAKSLSAIQKEIEERIEQNNLRDLIRTEYTDKGLELSLNSGLVFDSGSAVVRPEVISTLEQMLEALVPYADAYKFAVEGHTDSRPVGEGSMYPSNWELSTDRAHAVRRNLESVGIKRDKVRVEGYADTVALPEDELVGLSDAARLASHRRVVVRVY